MNRVINKDFCFAVRSIAKFIRQLNELIFQKIDRFQCVFLSSGIVVNVKIICAVIVPVEVFILDSVLSKRSCVVLAKRSTHHKKVRKNVFKKPFEHVLLRLSRFCLAKHPRNVLQNTVLKKHLSCQNH